ncbi:SgrR family transcriptional regulator [Paenibacillus aceris]|uniref:MarR-like DNA-binding transcriptional regulator SgrR of sgrS sRNA n=1 Tax=Paenibacillus aceris TaxID=869555 RepID=A0ABS4HYJ4_9BACL|nr:SgrR family transcriptional regulator [Paenibacillus aceris]MBP1963545.1 MarR-like DNA-binding transcriptional regulator SgrR of sgrS sRNA [Paenibacillus aceris]NHW36809.1 SgrR family transcriptional regulator [Paenibacillus aceris]
MQLLSHFLELRASFAHDIEHEPQPITLEELSERMYCTTRNVKILLKKMMEQDWISWKPGRGRGNVSELTFLVSAEDMVSKQAMELAAKGDYKGTIELIHQLGRGETLQDSFVDWLFSYFGYRTVVQEECYKDTLRFPVYKWLVSLDPAYSFFAFDTHLINQIFDTLVQYNPSTRIAEPHLAHYWEKSEDGLHYTFYLRKGVLFHHGREMTANDVYYSLSRLKELGLSACQGWMTESIESIRVLNRSAVAIELKQPNELFLQQLAHPSLAILPEEICRDNEGIFGRMPIGTGPFRLERNDDYICKLRAFDSYFGVRPHLDQLEIWLLPQELSEVGPSWDMVQVVCDHTNSRKPVGAVGKDSEWHQIEQSILGCSLLTFNQEKKGPQQHPNFRKAIDLIIDRERMIEQLGGFREAPASSFLPAMNDKGAAAEHRTDLEEARRLLEDMGYDGELLRMYIYSNNNEDALWICEQCVKVGIRIELTTRSMSDMMRLDTIQEADLIFYHICLESEYDLHIIQTLKQSNSYVRAHLNLEQQAWIDEEVEHILGIPHIEDRIAKLHEIIEVLQEGKSFLFVLHRSQQTTYHDSIRGVCINDLGWVDFRKIWFTPSA